MHENDEAVAYRAPSPELAALMEVPPFPHYMVSPDGTRVMMLEPEGLLPIAVLARPEVRLAGLRIDPATLTSGQRSVYRGLMLRDVAGGRWRRIRGLPRGAGLSWTAWAPDGTAVALTLVHRGRLTVWVCAASEARAVKLCELALNGVGGPPCAWLPDSSGLLCRLAPPRDGMPIRADGVPAGPVCTEHDGASSAPARTNPDLLKDAADEALFEYFLTSELAIVRRDGALTRLGLTGGVVSFAASPDMRYLLLHTIRRPYSRQVPWTRFPVRTEITDLAGHRLRIVAELPLAESIPIGRDAVRCGPRAVAWRPDQPAAVTWLEAADGGDPRVEASVRDRLFQLAAPFTEAPTELAALALRGCRILWGHARLALLREEWYKARSVRVWRIDPGAPATPPRRLFSYGLQDRYGDPGTPLLAPTGRGGRVLQTYGQARALLLAGPGGSPQGDRPFIDALDPETGSTRRVWQSRPSRYESPVAVTPTGQLLFTRESVAAPPNLFVRPLEGGPARRLTTVRHPAPTLAGIQASLLRYRRADGVELTARLYLPPGKTAADGPFPALLWAYPSEFKDPGSAGQVKVSPHRFPEIGWRSPLVWLTKGYAVLDRPDFPIIGEGEAEPNDTYIEQLSASAEAAVEELLRRGLAERERIAVGGHSYGGFMTANLLAHTRLFRAGIARSGAYNRTLTPFGFQAEERTLWEAPEVYARMSPFLHADRIRGPLLLIHGMADENEGTYTQQSERLFHALKGLGARVRLVLLPLEGHAYRARESVLHLLWETERFLAQHLWP